MAVGRNMALQAAGGAGLNPYDMDEVELIARTLMAEAGQEGPQGQLAAGAVMANRVADPRWGSDFNDVIMQPGQFSAYNTVTGYAGGSGGNDVWKGDIPQEVMQIAQTIASGEYEDPTGGATHYFNPDLADPKWGRGKKSMDIGNHRFLPEDGSGTIMSPGAMRVSTRSGTPDATGGAQPEETGYGALDEPRKGEKTTFAPGVALQGALSVLSKYNAGESDITSDLAHIRNTYFDERQAEGKRQQEERQRDAAESLFEGTKYEQAARDGADTGLLTNLLRQDKEFAQQTGLQDTRLSFQTFENLEDRNLRSELANRGFDIDFIRLGEANRMNDATIANWGITNAQTAAKVRTQNTQWAAEHALAQTQFQETFSRTQNQGVAAQEFIANTYEKMGDQKSADLTRSMEANAFSDPSMVNQLNTILAQPYATSDQRTSNMKNWDHYNSLKTLYPDDPQKAEAFWDSVNRPSTAINLGEKEGLAWTKSDITRSDTDIERVRANSRAVEAMTQMRSILDQHTDMETGPLLALMQQPLDVMNDLGILPPAFSETQNARAMIDQLNTFLATQSKTPGQVSNYEQQSWKIMNPGVGTPTENMDALLDFHTKGSQRQASRASWMRNAMQNNELNYSTADQQWERMVKEGAAITQPMFRNYDDMTAPNLQEMGPPQIGEVVYINGAPLLITDATVLADLTELTNETMAPGFGR